MNNVMKYMAGLTLASAMAVNVFAVEVEMFKIPDDVFILATELLGSSPEQRAALSGKYQENRSAWLSGKHDLVLDNADMIIAAAAGLALAQNSSTEPSTDSVFICSGSLKIPLVEASEAEQLYRQALFKQCVSVLRQAHTEQMSLHQKNHLGLAAGLEVIGLSNRHSIITVADSNAFIIRQHAVKPDVVLYKLVEEGAR